jgi:hypothetical protein
MKNIIEYCVPYEISVHLKQKLFNEPCLGVYQKNFKEEIETRFFKINMGHKDLLSNFSDGIWVHYWEGSGRPNYFELEEVYLMPMYEQVIEWLDEKHKIRVDLTHADSNGNYKYTIWRWNYDNNIGKWEKVDYINSFYDKKERNRKAIEEALKLI